MDRLVTRQCTEAIPGGSEGPLGRDTREKGT
jgi:hypothetical protein